MFYEIFHSQRDDGREKWISSVHLDNFCWSWTKKSWTEQWNIENADDE